MQIDLCGDFPPSSLSSFTTWSNREQHGPYRIAFLLGMARQRPVGRYCICVDPHPGGALRGRLCLRVSTRGQGLSSMVWGLSGFHAGRFVPRRFVRPVRLATRPVQYQTWLVGRMVVAPHRRCWCGRSGASRTREDGSTELPRSSDELTVEVVSRLRDLHGLRLRVLHDCHRCDALDRLGLLALEAIRLLGGVGVLRSRPRRSSDQVRASADGKEFPSRRLGADLALRTMKVATPHLVLTFRGRERCGFAFYDRIHCYNTGHADWIIY